MQKETKRIFLQITLFIITFITTTLAGTEWVYGRSIFMEDYSWVDFLRGLEYSIPLLLILTVHEFGHYFTALYHKVKASLPYYIPFPPVLPLSLGTMGAVIRLRSRPRTNVQTFDIGLAGPLAGFIVALFILFYGFKTLPPPEYVFQFHPEYEQYGLDYAKTVYNPEYMKMQENMIAPVFGSNLIFWIFQEVVADPARVPHAHELMHYPVLLACYIALFFTCFNLLPIGQLDGGQVLYGLFGFKIHKIIATMFFVALVFYSGLGIPWIHPNFNEPIWGVPGKFVTIPGYILFLYGCFKGLRLPQKETLMYALLMFTIHFLTVIYFPEVKGYQGYLAMAFILGRFIGVEHPGAEIEQPLDSKRVLLGWIALLIFVSCFSPAPIVIE